MSVSIAAFMQPNVSKSPWCFEFLSFKAEERRFLHLGKPYRRSVAYIDPDAIGYTSSLLTLLFGSKGVPVHDLMERQSQHQLGFQTSCLSTIDRPF